MSKRTGIVSGDTGRTYARSANAEPRESVSGSGDKGGRDCTNESKRKSNCNDQDTTRTKKGETDSKVSLLVERYTHTLRDAFLRW